MLPRIYGLSWTNALWREYGKPYFKELESFIKSEKDKGKIILPFPASSIFRAFELTPLDKVKVVIIGQDPYIGLGQATGLAFGVSKSEKIPPSLRNIFRELKSDLGISNDHGDLSNWAVQGVLLLNTILTVEKGASNSHSNKGWEEFTDAAIEATCFLEKPVVYWLLGKNAQMKKQLITNNRTAPTLIIEAAHPSPLSAHRGFFWSKPFSRTNHFLVKHKLIPIDWKL